MKKSVTYVFCAISVIAIVAALIAGSAGAKSEDNNIYLARQEEVHSAAELLRELGVSEDSKAIQALSEEWWRCEARLHPCFSEDEVIMLAKTIYGEAGSIKSVTEQACVAWTVCNHVDEPSLQVDSIKEALTKPGRFYYKSSFPANEELIWLARDVLERWNMEKLGYNGPGCVLPKDYLYYSGDGKHNYFRNAYRGGTRWDYSLPSPYKS